MADNFNINTTQGQANEAGGLDNNNNPAMTYVDFANQIAKNSQAQQEQEQAIQQAQLLTKQKQSAAAMGVNPELKDFLPINEAVGEMQAAGIDDSQIQAFVKMLGNQQVVSRAAVDTVIRKKELLTKLTKMSEPFQATDNGSYPTQLDGTGDGKLTTGQWYQAVVDTDGNISYVPSGEMPGAGKSAQAAESADRKDLSKLGADLAKITNPSRGNWVSSNIGRVGRALNEIHIHPDLPGPTLSYIQEEIGGIFMGGVPPQASLEESSILDLKQRINQRLNYITGNPQVLKNNDIKNQQAQYLISLLSTLHQSTQQMAQQMMRAKVAAYPDLQKDRPDDVANLLDQNFQILNAGISTEAQADMAAANGGQAMPGSANTPAKAPAANRPALADIFGGK